MESWTLPARGALRKALYLFSWARAPAHSSKLRKSRLPPGASLAQVAAGDLNGDGKLDLVTCDNNVLATGTNTIGVLVGNGAGQFHAAVTFATGTTPIAVVLADFNGDGKLDAATANYGSNDVSILFGNGKGSFSQPHANPVELQPRFLAAGKFHGGQPDLLVGGSNGIQFLLNLGKGTFASPVTVLSSGITGLAVADFNLDGNLDFVASLESSVYLVPGNGDGTFGTPVLITSFDGNVPFLAVGDFNGDGKPDIVVPVISSRTPTATDALFFGNGDGTFQAEIDSPSSLPSPYLAAADINGDGKDDLISIENLSSSVTVALSNGDGTFQGSLGYDGGYPGISLTIADINQDGKADILAADSHAVSILINETPAVPKM